jgi:methylthioribose-1-phosphate isomerase
MSAPMKVAGKHTRSIWLEPDSEFVSVIDQTLLPHRFATIRLETLEDAPRTCMVTMARR